MNSGTLVTVEFTIFALADAWYALEVSHVREVLRAAALSAAPGHPDLEGFFNLRGEIVPVINLRSQLDHPQQPLTASDFFVIVRSADDGEVAAIRTEGNVRLETVGETAIERTDGDGLIAGRIQLKEQIISLISVDSLFRFIAAT